MSGKMAARLQAATQSGKPVILRVDELGGHGIGATKQQTISELTDVFAFFLWQMESQDCNPEPAASLPADGDVPFRRRGMVSKRDHPSHRCHRSKSATQDHLHGWSFFFGARIANPGHAQAMPRQATGLFLGQTPPGHRLNAPGGAPLSSACKPADGLSQTRWRERSGVPRLKPVRDQ